MAEKPRAGAPPKALSHPPRSGAGNVSAHLQDSTSRSPLPPKASLAGGHLSTGTSRAWLWAHGSSQTVRGTVHKGKGLQESTEGPWGGGDLLAPWPQRLSPQNFSEPLANPTVRKEGDYTSTQLWVLGITLHFSNAGSSEIFLLVLVITLIIRNIRKDFLLTLKPTLLQQLCLVLRLLLVSPLSSKFSCSLTPGGNIRHTCRMTNSSLTVVWVLEKISIFKKC